VSLNWGSERVDTANAKDRALGAFIAPPRRSPGGSVRHIADPGIPSSRSAGYRFSVKNCAARNTRLQYFQPWGHEFRRDLHFYCDGRAIVLYWPAVHSGALRSRPHTRPWSLPSLRLRASRSNQKISKFNKRKSPIGRKETICGNRRVFHSLSY